MDKDEAWIKYMGNHVSPNEYKILGGDLESRIRDDLTSLWGNHPTDRLNNAEIARIASELAQWMISEN